MSAPLLLVVLCTQAAPDARSAREQVHFAFRQEHGAFVAGHDTHRVEADARGVVSFFPISDRDVGPGKTPFRLRVGALTRGARRLRVNPSSLAPASSVLEVRRDEFSELLHNGPDGVEQSFRFVSPPRGKGALVLELETGSRWLGHTQAGHHFSAGALSVLYGPATWVTSDGARVNLVTTRTPKGLRITVPAEVVARGPYPAVIDPLLSAELGVDAPVMVPPVTIQDAAAVAFDGTNFLVVWRDFRGGLGSDVYGTRVDAMGRVLDPVGLPIAAGPGGQFQPAVTFGAGQYYVTWSDTRTGGSDIYGTRVTLAGLPLDGLGVSLTNATGLQANPDVVFNGTDYLVVWEDLRRTTDSPDIHGTRVNTAGVVLDPTPNLTISVAIWGQYQPRLDADLSTGTSLVVWEDARNPDSDIYGALVDVGGAVGPNLPINRGALSQSKVDVAFNGTHYVVVWSDRRASNSDIYSTRLTPAGAVLDMAGVPISVLPGDQDWPAIAGTSTQYAVWRDQRAVSGSDVYGTVITPNGMPLSAAGTAICNTSSSQLEPKLAFGAGQFFTAFTDDRNGNQDIYGTRVVPAGPLDPAGILLNIAGNQQAQVAIASDGTDFLVVWQDFRAGGADIYGIRMAASGDLLDAVAFVISGGPGNESSPAVAWDGQQYVVAWTDMRSGNADIYAARVSAGGMLLDAAGLPVSTSLSAESAPTVASLGAGALIAWQDSRSGTLDIYAGRMLQNGTLLDGAGLLVSNAASDQSGVKAIAFGAGYLLAWTDFRAGNSDIYAARLDATGVVLDSSGVGIATDVTPADGVALSSSPSQALILWRDTRAGAANPDIYGARLAVGGTGFASAAFPVANAVGPQAAPVAGWDRPSSTWTVFWEDLSVSLDGQVFTSDVSAVGVVSAPALLSPGRAPAISYSTATPGLLGYIRFIQGDVNIARVRLRLAGNRAVGAPCSMNSECLSGRCGVTGLCNPAAMPVDAGLPGPLDAGPSSDAGSDAGVADAGTDAGASDAGTSDAGTTDAGTTDAGVADAGSDGGTDAGELADAGMTSDGGAEAPAFVGGPSTMALCNEAWRWTPVVSGPGPTRFSLVTGPLGMLIESDGTLAWTPPAEGTQPVVILATGPGGARELRFEVEVECTRRSLNVGCGCDSGPALIVLLAASLLRRRRGRR